MADLVMRKRPALHAGEIGLFIDSPVFEDDFGHIRQGTDVVVTATQSRNIKQMRLAWALAGKIAKSGVLGDADSRDVMNYLLKKAKHVRYIANQHRDGVEVEIIVKSIRFAQMEQTAFDRLFNRMIYIVATEILPDVPEGVIREEIEKMSGVSTPEPEAPKPPRQRRTRAAAPAPDPVAALPPPSPEPARAEPPGDLPEASSPPPAAPPPSPPAATEVKTGEAPKSPTNVPEWETWTAYWLEQANKDVNVSPEQVLSKWNGERTLRNTCGVTADDRQPFFETMETIVEAKRRKAKPL